MLYNMIRYGEWSWGFDYNNEWPEKCKLGVFNDWYDGYHFSIHVWKFWVYCAY